jgi:UDP-glucose 4-epimerase
MSEAQKQAEGDGEKATGAPARGVVRTGKPGGTIALTGVNTHLGSSLVALLERERKWRKIVAIDLKNAPAAGPKTRFYKIDLSQPAVDAQLAEILQAERVDTVVHGAFLSQPTHATAWAHELESVGTMHVLNACEEHGVSKLVLRSTTMLYGARPDNPLYLTEDHPLRGDERWPFIGDKLDAERQVIAFAERRPGTVVTVLRIAPTLGRGSQHYLTQTVLGQRVVPLILGYDPLVQLVHELDVVAAFHAAINEDHPGVFNVVAPGVLPLTSVLRLAGRLEAWVPYPVANVMLQVLSGTHLARSSPAFLDYLKYPCVASGEKAAELLGFRASYSTREALHDYLRAMRQQPNDDGTPRGRTAPQRRSR